MNAMTYTMDWVAKHFDIENHNWTFPVYNDLLDEIFTLRSSIVPTLPDEIKWERYKKLATMMANYDTEVALASL